MLQPAGKQPRHGAECAKMAFLQQMPDQKRHDRYGPLPQNGLGIPAAFGKSGQESRGQILLLLHQQGKDIIGNIGDELIVLEHREIAVLKFGHPTGDPLCFTDPLRFLKVFPGCSNGLFLLFLIDFHAIPPQHAHSP